MAVQFDWDPAKAVENEEKHGISFEEAKAVFYDHLARVSGDTVEGHREIIVGHSKGNLLFVVYEEDVENEIVRIISARKTTRKERRRYEEE